MRRAPFAALAAALLGREAAKFAVNDATFQSSLGKVETPIQYLDQPQFRAFWDADARKLAEVVKKIGRVE
jgi:hypothetical protein